jgi:DNA-binding transcriptional LysR family regulator
LLVGAHALSSTPLPTDRFDATRSRSLPTESCLLLRAKVSRPRSSLASCQVDGGSDWLTDSGEFCGSGLIAIDDLAAVHQACRAGMGFAMLPSVLARTDDGLIAHSPAPIFKD